MIPYREITIDLIPRLLPPEPLLSASQYDNGRPVKVHIQYDGTDFNLAAGVTAKIQVRKPSGKVVIADALVSTGTNVVTFNLLTQMTAEYGLIPMELSLTGDGQEPIGTANWTAYIEKSPASGSPSDTWVQDLDEKVEQATEAAESADQDALDSEAWAVGERGGVPVTNVDPTYQNNAAYYAGQAGLSAQAAAGSAGEAAGSEAQASVYAGQASGYATRAETAQGKAEDAQRAAEVAQGLAEGAQRLSEVAQGKSETAQGKAETAQGKAEDAQTAAETAQGKAEAAQTAAETAQGRAEYAQGKAEDAQTAAESAQGYAEGYATAASGSANTSSTQALKSEGYAVGTQDGTPVASGSPYYEYNSKYFADEAAAVAASIPEDYTELSEDVANLSSALAIEIQNTVTDVIALTWTENYYVDPADGQVKSNSNREYSNKVSVNPGDVITLYRESDGAAFQTIAFIAAYYNDVLVSDKGATSVSNPWTVPDGVDAIIMSIAKAYGNVTGDRTYTDTTLIPKLTPDVNTLYNIIAPSKPGRIAYSFDVSANGTFTGTDDFQDECGYRICFDAKITSVTGEVKIGKGIGQTYGGGIGFDGTNLYQYMGTASNPVRTQAHGLTLKDYVSITLDHDYSGQAVVTISTNGGMYTWTIPVWRSYYGVLTVESVNALTGCVLSYTSACAKKDIWVFGDSYITYRDTTRWMYYLVQTGHTEYLINGYPGRNSSSALAALKVALKMHHVPKTLIWLLGMNDKDSADAPNSNWMSALTEVIGICAEYHIELILSTIPNVPSENTDNTKKNAWVTSHDYRYIDFANAVSANGSSTWYDGMLSSDNVHPDVQGAIALYSCAVTEVPELLL